MIARQRSTCASDEQHAARINAAENTVRKNFFFLELALNFRTRTHLNGVKLREHTYNASTIFQYSGWCLAVLKMCNNLKKKTHPQIFLDSSHLLRFKYLEVAQSPCGVACADESSSTCIKLPAKPVFTQCFAFFLSPFLYFYGSRLSALLHSHFPAQHGAGKGSAWELI